ncbi:hypothetical protein EG344_14960 [Chryseobacterium sp. G0162]|uniref:Uncharacterized protein n=1 Tax=Chryseobacterium nakagawai TaxID=1241982 RepID=A0AAD0YM59_CHRNA|nr:hypothetical protein EG343_10160 [Chryseobacterium nakagawai]AZB10018.1 hypothetical protein EG344_14960 [Chryseobacterium sp. G0162]
MNAYSINDVSLKDKDMKKSLFRLLNVINKKVLPKLSNKDPNTLTKVEKGILAYRYFVLVNSLD